MSGNGRTILGFWKKDFSSNLSAGYINCNFWQNGFNYFVRILEKASVKVPKQGKTDLCQKSENLFFWMFLCSRRLHFSLSRRNVSGRLSKNFAPSPKLKNYQLFPKAVFFRKHAPLDNWNAVLNILPKRFYQSSGKNFCINPKMTWFF